MVSASVQVIYESVESLMSNVDHFTKNSTELPNIDMGPIPITVMCVTIGMFILIINIRMDDFFSRSL